MAVKYRDYYETLGLSRSATEKEIKAAYRKLARKYHPDVNKDPSSSQKFKEVSEAYEVLRDPEKRKRYDQLGHNWEAGQEFSGFDFGGYDFSRAQTHTTSDFSDFFDILFGNMGAGSGFRRTAGRHPFESMGQEDRFGYRTRPAPQKGADRETDLNITVEEAYQGARKDITLRSSREPRTHSLQVKIPPRATEGMKIRVPKKGTPGQHGGEPGDLFLRIRIRPGDAFSVEGKDLVAKLEIPFWDAVLGADREISLFGETIPVRIPPGTPGGQRIRIPGKGLKNRTGQGDLLVEVRVRIPDDLQPEETALVESLRDRYEKRH